MRTKSEIGSLGESLACEYLKQKGYHVVIQNYRYKRSEIDIIAEKDNILTFVEVKTRSGTSFGTPEQAVDNKKAQKVIEGAEQYIYDTNWNSNIRFDIISVEIKKGRHIIEHFEDAFY